MKIRVYYEDTDAGGVVYHSRYLNFCERVRSEAFFDKMPEIFDKDKGHFLVSKAECKFLKSAKLGDDLEVKSYLVELKKASLILKQEIFKDSEKIFEANFTLVFVKNSKAAAMSEDIKKAFASVFAKS